VTRNTHGKEDDISRTIPETETETETEKGKPPPMGTSVGKRAVSLTDLASLARSNEAAPPESIWEAARREKRAEKPGEPTAGNRDEDLATPEPLRGKNATWDALDRLTNAVTEKLQSEDEGDAAE
jgi:hypothetical protein